MLRRWAECALHQHVLDRLRTVTGTNGPVNQTLTVDIVDSGDDVAHNTPCVIDTLLRICFEPRLEETDLIDVLTQTSLPYCDRI